MGQGGGGLVHHYRGAGLLVIVIVNLVNWGRGGGQGLLLLGVHHLQVRISYLWVGLALVGLRGVPIEVGHGRGVHGLGLHQHIPRHIRGLGGLFQGDLLAPFLVWQAFCLVSPAFLLPPPCHSLPFSSCSLVHHSLSSLVCGLSSSSGSASLVFFLGGSGRSNMVTLHIQSRKICSCPVTAPSLFLPVPDRVPLFLPHCEGLGGGVGRTHPEGPPFLPYWWVPCLW